VRPCGGMGGSRWASAARTAGRDGSACFFLGMTRATWEGGACCTQLGGWCLFTGVTRTRGPASLFCAVFRCALCGLIRRRPHGELRHLLSRGGYGVAAVWSGCHLVCQSTQADPFCQSPRRLRNWPHPGPVDNHAVVAAAIVATPVRVRRTDEANGMRCSASTPRGAAVLLSTSVPCLGGAPMHHQQEG